MANSNTYSDAQEQHYSVDELLVWLAGKGSAKQRTAIAEHLSHCEMCHDTMEGLIHYEAPEGIRARENTLYSDFRTRVMADEKNKRWTGWTGNMNLINILLIFLACLLFAAIVGALFLFMSAREEDEQSAPANRVDSAYQYKIQETEEPHSSYIPDSNYRDRELEAILRSDQQMEYQESPSSASRRYDYGPAYDYYTPSDPLVYTIKKVRNDDVTLYDPKSGPGRSSSTTPTGQYFGYEKSPPQAKASHKEKDQKVRIGDQLIDLRAVADDAQAYETSGEYSKGIQELEKYQHMLPDTVAEIDYWLSRLYVKNGNTEQARALLKRLASYPNSYQSVAQEWLDTYR